MSIIFCNTRYYLTNVGRGVAMYIAVEGLKGVGKSTLLDSLCQRLRDENVRFSLLTPTRPLPYACWIEGLAKHWPSLRQYDYFCQSLSNSP